MLVEQFLTLSKTRRPRRMVADFRRTIDSGSMTGRAHFRERRLSGRWNIGCSLGFRCIERRKRTVVLSSDRLMSKRCDVALDVLPVQRFEQNVLALRRIANVSRDHEEDYGEENEQAQHDTEGIKKLGI